MRPKESFSRRLDAHSSRSGALSLSVAREAPSRNLGTWPVGGICTEGVDCALLLLNLLRGFHKAFNRRDREEIAPRTQRKNSRLKKTQASREAAPAATRVLRKLTESLFNNCRRSSHAPR